MPLSPRTGLPSWHPAALLATWFGVGLLPWAPGTWGSLAALPVGWAITHVAGATGLAVATALVFAVGCWAAAATARAAQQADPGFIVIDEVAAQWLVLLPAPQDWRIYAAGFLVFRLFDIAKPWPARAVERHVRGGLGVMLDDIVAALYALALLLVGEGVVGVRP